MPTEVTRALRPRYSLAGNVSGIGLCLPGKSLDGAGAVAVGGMLYAPSGYGGWGGAPGNVSLAYSVDGR